MARIRTIKPEFFSSEQVADVSTTSRLLFVGLWCFVDDQGVHPWKPRQIKMEVFPGDNFTNDQIEGWLRELEDVGLIIRFEAEDRQYLAVTGWHHQKIEKPRFIHPKPPKSVNSPTIRRRVSDESPNGSGGVGSLPDRTRPDPTEPTPTPTVPASSVGVGDVNLGKAKENLVAALVTRDVKRPRDAVDSALARGVTVDALWDVVAYWESTHGSLQAGALHDRLTHAEPGQRPDAGWPEHARPDAKPKRKAPPDSEALAVVREYRRAKRSDVEIAAALASRGLKLEGFTDTNGEGEP